MDGKMRFTLTLSTAVGESFKTECQRRGVGRTAVLRSFLRQWLRIESADFGVVPVEQLSLGLLTQLQESD